MAELAPIPSASVSTTVTASPLVRPSERNATLKSLTNDIILLFLSGSQPPQRYSHSLASHPFCVILLKRIFPSPPSSRDIPSPSPLLTLVYDFTQIHQRPYFNRSKSILKAWCL